MTTPSDIAGMVERLNYMAMPDQNGRRDPNWRTYEQAAAALLASDARVRELENDAKRWEESRDWFAQETIDLKTKLAASDASIIVVKQQLSDVEHSCLTITNHMSRERIASDALIKRAGEVLKPFEQAMEDSADDRAPDNMDIWESPVAQNITWGHLRALRTLAADIASGFPTPPKVP